MAKLREVADQLNLSNIAATNRKLLQEQERTNHLLQQLLELQQNTRRDNPRP